MSQPTYPIEGSTPPLSRHRAVGPTHPGESFEVTLKLRRRSTEGLPTHAEFIEGKRHFPSRREHAQRYGAAPADIRAVARWASSRGLAVSRAHGPSRSVKVSGTAEAFAKAFGVELRTYRHADSGEHFRGHDGPIHLDSEINGVVTGVLGLDSYPIVRSHRRVHPAADFPVASQADATASADTASGDGASSMTPAQMKAQWPTAWFPTEVAKLYDFPDVDVSRQKIAILEFGGGFDQATLTDYFQNTLGIDTPVTVNAFSVDKQAQNINSGATGEVYLDIEVIGGMVPAATIDVYFAPQGGQGYLDAIDAAIHNGDYAAISISWGLSEDAEGYWSSVHDQVDEAFQDAIALGIPVFVSSGDNGSGDTRQTLQTSSGQPVQVTERSQRAHANYPASSPYATACGGTQLYGSDGSITHEVVWNEQNGPYSVRGIPFQFYQGGATGGGVSDQYTTVPSYQSGVAGKLISSNPGGATGRGLPDVAGNAGSTTGYLVSQPPGGPYAVAPVGGTSAAAPMWAALAACLKAGAEARIGGNLPAFHFNDFVYAVGSSDGFRDIVEGADPPPSNDPFTVPTFTATGNNESSMTDGYSSSAGFDLCTGWGSPSGNDLLSQLVSWLQSRSNS